MCNVRSFLTAIATVRVTGDDLWPAGATVGKAFYFKSVMVSNNNNNKTAVT